MESIRDFIFENKGIKTRLRFVAEGILRVTRTRRAEFLEDAPNAAVLTGGEKAQLEETGGEKVFSLGGLKVCVDESGAMTIRAGDRALLREPKARPYLMEANGEFDTCRQDFVFSPSEGLYGLGSHEEGYGNLRGKSRLLYQHNLKAVVPFLVSTAGWGILFDMGCFMTFHDDAQGSYLWAERVKEMDWYFLYGGGDYPGLMEKHRLLTGETPMLPLYALGFIQSKERYQNAQEVLDVAGEYRRRGVPLDLMVQDWMSWPEGQWGYKVFDEERFPEPEKWTAALHQMNVRLMLSIWPAMRGDKNKNLEEMREKGYLLPDGVIYNAFDPDARALYWRQANEGLFRYGVDAWWCDCSEPYESDWNGSIRPEPFQRAEKIVEEATRNLPPDQISLFSLRHTKGIYEGQRSVTEDQRVFNLTRSSWAGQHRYAAATWSGDVSAAWEVLRRHVPEGLNFCAAGEAYWSTDCGAFFPGRGEQWFINGDFDGGVSDPGYRELFVRWMQYSVFLPLMRAHGTGTPREIWRFGEKGQPFYDAIEGAIRLRYALIPFLYSLMAACNRCGVPMTAPPALYFPKDEELMARDDEMLVGGAVLVKPVTRPMYYLPGGEEIGDGSTEEEVYLPRGADWYDLHTGQRYEGGQTVTVNAPLDRIPVFVKAGTVLPWGGEAQYTGELKTLPLGVRLFPGGDGAMDLYEDAEDGYGYERGQRAVTPIRWDDRACILRIGARQGEYPGMVKDRQWRIILPSGAQVSILYDGSATAVDLSDQI